MNFNLNKCYAMSITRSRQIIDGNYMANGIILNRVTSVTDLGLTVTSTLNWDAHIKKITSKASSRLGMVKRTLGANVNSDIKLIAYKALVRPHLEYCSQLWSYNSKKSIMLIERIQRRASCFILNQFDVEYKTRLSMCDLLPLAVRRDFLDLTFCYNVINNLIDIDVLSIFKCQDNEIPRRIICKTEQYFKFYPSRIFHLWTILPDVIKSTELSISGSNVPFKKALKSWLKEQFNLKFDSNNTCSWVLYCRCANCRIV
jgi:hypothetical protein